MGFLEEMMVLPPPDHLPLLGYVLAGTLMLHVPYMALTLGCTVASLTANAAGKWKASPAFSRLARDIMAAVPGSPWLGLALGVLPQLVIMLILSQVLFERGIFRMQIHAAVPVLALPGIVFAYGYRYALSREDARFEPAMLLGTAAAGLIMLGFLIFHGAMGIVENPDSWTVRSAPAEFILASSVTPDYLRFLTLSLGLAGGWMLFLYFGWPEAPTPRDRDYRAFLKTAGIAMVGAFVMFGPLFTLWHGLATHTAAVTPASLALLAASLVSIIAAGLLLAAFRGRAESRLGLLIFPTLVLSYVAAAADGHVLRQKATIEHRELVASEGERIREQLMARLEGDLGEATSAERGRQVFEGRCASCHRFDGRLVGPPMAEVLPKYEGRPEDLEGFINNPVKVNPDYPPMPRLGLRRTEIEAVVNYLQQRTAGEGED